MSDKLKPCPFCGKDPVLLATHETDNFIRWYEVRCDECGIGLSEEYEGSAVELWNTRAALAQPQNDPEAVAYVEIIGRKVCSVRFDKSVHCTVPVYLAPPSPERMREALRDVIDNGLIYWEPNTERGHVQKALMIARCEKLLALRAGDNHASDE